MPGFKSGIYLEIILINNSFISISLMNNPFTKYFLCFSLLNYETYS